MFLLVSIVSIIDPAGAKFQKSLMQTNVFWGRNNQGHVE